MDGLTTLYGFFPGAHDFFTIQDCIKTKTKKKTKYFIDIKYDEITKLLFNMFILIKKKSLINKTYQAYKLNFIKIFGLFRKVFSFGNRQKKTKNEFTRKFRKIKSG